MLNAYLFIQSGIPVIYSGDEDQPGQRLLLQGGRDYDRRSDSRYIHRGHFRWDLEPEKDKKERYRIGFCFDEEDGRAQIQISSVRWGRMDVWTEETYDTALLCVCRKSGNEMVTGIFNFSNGTVTAWINMGEFTWKDLFTGEKRVLRGVPVPARGLRMVLPQMGLKSLAKERKYDMLCRLSCNTRCVAIMG